MKLRARWQSLWLLALPFTVLALQVSQESLDSIDGRGQIEVEQQKDGDNRLHKGRGGPKEPSGLQDGYVYTLHANTPEGRHEVHSAWHSLQELDTSSGTKNRFHEPDGLFEVTWHYTKLLFRLLFMNEPSTGHKKDYTDRPYSGIEQVGVLRKFASVGDPDAIFLLAEMNFYGNFSYSTNYTRAFGYYQQLASLNGNSTAQSMVGFIYATGIGAAAEADQAKALLYHTFAAEQGNTKSEMTVAYRHHAGIGTGRNCDRAVHYYKRVADKAMDYWRSGPPGGRYLVRDAYHWADESGGVYGEGASVSSSGQNANRDKNSASTEDIMDYLDMLSRKGDLKATFSLAKMYYDGSRVTKRNLRKAQRLFMKIARQYWDKNGKIISGGQQGIDKIAAKAAAHIGRMFLRGEGWEQSNEKAATWFRRGITNGDPLCQYLMGVMYRDGLGVARDSFKAASYFKVAADEDIGPAQSALGVLFLDQGELETAGRYFEVAARHGYIEAYYYLAELTNKGVGRERQCSIATFYYKVVSEGVEEIHSSFAEANAAYENNQLDTAVVLSLMAAEQGYEDAQANAAYLIDEHPPILKMPSIPGTWTSKARPSPALRNASLALVSWTRSAKQSNIDSLLKMGDYYLSGLGMAHPDPEKASTCYHTAADPHHSAQALWNLGWMHENGIAVEQDFHMAKRYYDLALEMNSESYLPVKLALIKLRARSYWNTVTRGKINSIQSEPVEAKKSRTFSEWIAQFLDHADQDLDETDTGNLDDLDIDTTAFVNNDAAPPGGGDDGYYDDIDDGLVETLIIIGLAATLAFLVYYRQQRQLHQQRNNNQGNNPPAPAPGQAPVPHPTGAAANPESQRAQAQAQQPPDAARQEQEQDQERGGRGFFPNPGDPDYAAWAAGGVGH